MSASLPPSKQFTYALGQLGWSILVNVVGLMLVYFYLPPETAGIPNFITTVTFLGVINAIVLIGAGGRVFDAITDPLIASWSDRSRHPKGRRIPMMAKGAVPAAVTLALMFIPVVNGKSAWNIVWLSVMSVVFYFSLTLYVTPFYALIAEFGHTPRERLNISTWISITYALGLILAAMLPVIGGAFEAAFGLETYQGFQAAVAVLAVFALIMLFMPVLTIHEPTYSSGEPTSIPLLPALKSTLANRQFRLFVFSDFVYFTALTIVITGLFFYVTVLLEQPEELVSSLLTVTVVASFVVYPLVNFLAKRVGKKPLVIVSFLVMAGVFGNVIVLGRLDIDSTLQAYLLMLVYSLPLAFLSILPVAVLADIAEWDASLTGERKEGMFYAARTLMQKVGQTFGVMTFAMLTTFGRDIGDDLGIRLSGVVGAVLCVLAAVLFVRYDEKTVVAGSVIDEGVVSAGG